MSDTRRDIERDRWWRDHEGFCGTCALHCRDDAGDYICENDHSENYGLWTEYNDGCGEWIGRK